MATPAAAAESRGKGTVTLDATVKRFAVSGRQIVGRGEITARLTDYSGGTQTVSRRVRLAFSLRRATAAC